MPTKIALRILIAFVSLFSLGPAALATNISGVVKSSTDKYVTVGTSSSLIPRPGDKAQIYFVLPGANIEVSVATGHVYEITGRDIMIQIEKATGKVEKDQLVRITSAGSSASPPKIINNPGAPTSTTPAATKTSAASRPSTVLGNIQTQIVGTWQGARHRRQFFANGTFITDPYVVPNPPICRWSIIGDRLYEQFPDRLVSYQVLAISGQELVSMDVNGQIWRSKRIPDDQAAREKAK